MVTPEYDWYINPGQPMIGFREGAHQVQYRKGGEVFTTAVPTSPRSRQFVTGLLTDHDSLIIDSAVLNLQLTPEGSAIYRESNPEACMSGEESGVSEVELLIEGMLISGLRHMFWTTAKPHPERRIITLSEQPPPSELYGKLQPMPVKIVTAMESRGVH
ncbi:hypothetical protein HYU19_01650 [Candidatus Woesearchaeota archaeon]|nr:hypothetical protein [Candidatus Woesearchaeota archaeon]